MARPKGFSNGFSQGFGASTTRGYLALNAGHFPSYEDGDVISAVSWKMIKHNQARILCWEKDGGRQIANKNEFGFLSNTHILKDLFEAIYEFKYERLTDTTAKVVRLSDDNEIEFTTKVPFVQHDGKTVSMNIQRQFNEMISTWNNPNKGGTPLFSDDGDKTALVYYGGEKDSSEVNLDTLWVAIESKLGVFEKNLPPPNFGSLQNKLVISVNDFDDATAADLVAPLIDDADPENPIFLKKRKSHIDWRDLRDVVESEVLSIVNGVNIHQIRKHVRSEIVLTKVVP